jgi:probable F420-dependent oxidoreductase
MNVGVVFPQTEIGPDPAAIRDYVQAAEAMGYSHLIVYDHVLGADAQHYPDFAGTYGSKDMFHEPFVLFGFLASITSSLELVTAVIILGQRQTALVAKQAAEVDVLSGGRLRLGIGVGWNHVEYEALDQNFHNRGRRSEEQIALLRALWTDDVVNFQGRWHQVTHAGINPLPVQRPIPIWLGVGGRENPTPDDRVLRRVARLSDGWFPQFVPDDAGRATLAKVQEFAKEAGRDPSSIGLEARINVNEGDPEFWQERATAWRGLGATHISVNTMGAGLQSPQDHINTIQQFKEVIPA